MDTVVIYPGRFHPFHKGHKSVYDTLIKRFGKERVFIATSAKVDPPKSPFTFEEKRAMIALTGVDPSRVIQTKSPYQATEITDNYDPQNTIALFAVSDKDMAEDPRFSFKPKKDGSPSYYQPAQKEMKSLDTHGYIVTVPTLSFTVLGEPMRSASEFRARFAGADEQTQQKMITDMFGKYDQKIHRIMSQKISESLIRADEILEKLIEMGADDHYILEACYRVDALAESIMKPRKSLFKELKSDRSRFKGRYDKIKLIKPIKKLPNLKEPSKPTRFDKRRQYSQIPEQHKQKEAYDPKHGHDSFGHVEKHKDKKGKAFWAVYNMDDQIVKTFYSEKSASNFADKNHDALMSNKLKANEEITKFDNVDPMKSVIAIRGIGTMTIPQALNKVAEMSDAVSKLAQELDHKDIQDNIPRYMSLLATYNDSIQVAYKELAQQRKRGGTKSRGIDKDITEAKDVSYDNWDHEESAKYSKYLEETFGEPDEFTNEQTVWHNIDGFKRVVCRDEYILHCCPAPHYDFVYSYIDLEIDEQLSDELAECSGSILIDHLKNEVGARCGSLTANAVTLNFCLDVAAGRTKPVPEEYERRIKEMKAMFENGEKWTVDWWPDKAGDADPKNPFYKD
tara:strand:- start:1255 stop:3120 length:1866 start_codon:yes stop_codon:yes gene_type:complete